MDDASGFIRLPGEHPVAAFHRWVAAIPHGAYPPELAPVGGRHVRGVAAFPGGDGLYIPCGDDVDVRPEFPMGGLAVVANHLDGVDGYLARVRDGPAHGDPCAGAKRMPYWRVLYDDLLEPAGIGPEWLFATNLHPALWALGRNEGAVRRGGPVHEAWRRHVEAMLTAELEVMKPRAIVAFGADARRAVSDITGVDLGAPPGPVTAMLPSGHRVAAAALLHPSARKHDVDRRTWGGLTGRAADAVLLAATWEAGSSLL